MQRRHLLAAAPAAYEDDAEEAAYEDWVPPPPPRQCSRRTRSTQRNSGALVPPAPPPPAPRAAARDAPPIEHQEWETNGRDERADATGPVCTRAATGRVTPWWIVALVRGLEWLVRSLSAAWRWIAAVGAAAAAEWRRARRSVASALPPAGPPHGPADPSDGSAERSHGRAAVADRPPPTADDWAAALRAAAAGTPAPAAASTPTEAAMCRLRATRATRTVAKAAATLRSMATLVEANADDPAPDLDSVIERWLVARITPRDSCWRVPPGWARSVAQPVPCGKDAGTARSALTRLGYASGPWPRSVAMARALGCGTTYLWSSTLPIFAWQLLAGARRSPPQNVWEECLLAFLLVGALSPSRTGVSKRCPQAQIVIVHPDEVSIVIKERQKQDRASAAMRAGALDRPLRIQHWCVERWVVPWLRKRAHWPTGFAFPSIVFDRTNTARTANGCALPGGRWLEPVRPLSDNAIGMALRRFVVEPPERLQFRGLRKANNIELRRNAHVQDVTRRHMHGRTVRDLIGSEFAYEVVLAEEMRLAVSALGSLRLQRDADGLLTCTATSASAGRVDDWVATPHAQRRVDAALDDAATDDSSTASDASQASSPDDGRVAFACDGCGVRVRKQDPGFLCDAEGCDRGRCLTCHPGGSRAALWCARHRPAHPAGGASAPRGDAPTAAGAARALAM